MKNRTSDHSNLSPLYTFQFPRNSVFPTIKIISPKLHLKLILKLNVYTIKLDI